MLCINNNVSEFLSGQKHFSEILEGISTNLLQTLNSTPSCRGAELKGKTPGYTLLPPHNQCTSATWADPSLPSQWQAAGHEVHSDWSHPSCRIGCQGDSEHSAPWSWTWWCAQQEPLSSTLSNKCSYDSKSNICKCYIRGGQGVILPTPPERILK